MQNRIVAATAVALVVAALTACSSTPEGGHPSQASVTIDGNTVASNQKVTCIQQTDNLPGRPLQMYRIINVGDETVSGVKAMLKDSGESFIANSVHIRNLGGFTGVFSRGAGEDARVTFSAETFTITGTANGSSTYKPDEPATATFKIVATC